MINKKFNFHGAPVQIASENLEILSLMEKNFSYFFRDSMETARQGLKVEVYLKKEIPYKKIPSLISSSQTRNAIIYEKDHIRYCDYYGQGLIIFDKIKNRASIYVKDLEFAHELTYLFIMSRVGKALDQKGLHRVHACGFSFNGTPVVCMMPMKGGKSSLILEMLKLENVEIISDDTPLISSDGKIHSFPLRFGLDHIPSDWDFDPKFIFSIERKEFGKKWLFDIRGFGNAVYSSSSSPKKSKQTPMLVNGVRTSFAKGRIETVPKYKLIFPLMKYLGIGLGLPIIIEHFLESGFKDWRTRVWIFCLRIKCVFNLLRRSRCAQLYLGTDKEENIKLIKDYLGQQLAQK